MGVVNNDHRIRKLEENSGGGGIAERLSHLEDEYTKLQSYALGEVLIGEYYNGDNLYRHIYHFDTPIVASAQSWFSADTTIENIDKIISANIISGHININADAEYQNDMLKVFNTYPETINVDEIIIYYTKTEE